MSNYNICERDHGDIEGFVSELARASRDIRTLESLGALGIAEPRLLMAVPTETPALPQVSPRLLEGVK